MLTLYQLSAEERLIEDLLSENGGEITPEIEAQLAQSKEAIAVKADGYLHVIQNFANLSDRCAEEIKRLQALKKTADNAQKNIRNHIANVMQSFDTKRIEGNACKISLRASEKLECSEEDIIMPHHAAVSEFQATLPSYISVELKVSKTELKKSLLKGEPVKAQIVPTYSIQIR